MLECLNKQSVASAKRVFEDYVEDFMIRNGYWLQCRSSEFIRLVRQRFEAEDEPGIASSERCL